MTGAARSRVELGLAGPADDQALREFLELSTLPGEIQLVLARNPSFFAGSAIMGDLHQVVVAREAGTGRIVGMAERSERRLFVRGRAATVGYLSGVRILPGHRRGTILARGFQQMRRLHEASPVPFYLTTVAAQNDQARQVLTSGRAGLPRYHPFGTLVTLALPVARRARPPAPAGLQLEPGAAGSLDEVVSFLHEFGARRQFFPAPDRDRLATGVGQHRGLGPGRFLLARRRGALTGVCALWDQRPFKQSVVKGYGRRMSLLRPFYNAWAGFAGVPPIPDRGAPVPSQVAALVAIRDDDPLVFGALLEGLIAMAAAEGTSYLGLGLHDRDPLLPIVDRFRPFRMVSHVYLVTFDDDPALIEGLADRIPYLEVGTL